MSRAGTLRTEICGVHFDMLDMSDVVRHIIAERDRGSGGWVTTPNVDIVRQVTGDPELAQLVAGAPLVILDGAPVSWAGRIAGRPPVPRVPGASLVEPLSRAAAQAGAPVLLLGGRPGASERAAARLASSVPGLRITHHCPPYGFDEDLELWARVVSAGAECEGGIVFCGFGFPKQERLMRELSLLFPRTWFLGIGGSIDFIAGEIPRAPRLVQRAGFEWAFRLLTEPRRLARRYLVDGMPFAAHMVGWAVRERVRGGSGAIRPSADQPSIDLRDLIPTQRAHSDSVSPVVEQIDLHGRTVAVLIPGPRPRSISLSFAQYRAAVAAGRLPEPAAPTGSGLGDRSVVDLRDAAAARRDPGPVSGPTSTGERRTW